MNNAVVTPELSIGSHSCPEDGMCAMEAVSLEQGCEFSEFPDTSDRTLAKLCQGVNDHICTHTGTSILCRPCANISIKMARRTAGTISIAPKQKSMWWSKFLVSDWGIINYAQTEKNKDAITRIANLYQRGAQDNPSIDEWRTADAATDAAATDAAYAAYAATYATTAAAATTYAAGGAGGAAIKGRIRFVDAAITEFWKIMNESKGVDHDYVSL